VSGVSSSSPDATITRNTSPGWIIWPDTVALTMPVSSIDRPLIARGATNSVGRLAGPKVTLWHPDTATASSHPSAPEPNLDARIRFIIADASGSV
jgi:hypothetical protein